MRCVPAAAARWRRDCLGYLGIAWKVGAGRAKIRARDFKFMANSHVVCMPDADHVGTDTVALINLATVNHLEKCLYEHL